MQWYGNAFEETSVDVELFLVGTDDELEEGALEETAFRQNRSGGM